MSGPSVLHMESRASDVSACGFAISLQFGKMPLHLNICLRHLSSSHVPVFARPHSSAIRTKSMRLLPACALEQNRQIAAAINCCCCYAQAWKRLDGDKPIRKLLDEHLKSGADNPAYELLLGLLRPNPKARFSIADVTASTFLTGGAALNTILGETKVRWPGSKLPCAV